MEIKFTIDAPRGGLRRLLLFTGLPIAVVLTFALTAQALDTSWIAAGQTLSAAKLKASFEEVSARLAAIEAAQGKQVQVSAEVTESGTIVRQFSTAGWTLNPTRPSVGNYVLSFGGGLTLSAPPICTTAPLWGRNDFIRVGGDDKGTTESVASVSVRTASWDSGKPEDSGFTIVCFGTKI
jgi:hypothetical protein